MELEEEYDCCPVCYEDHGQAFNGILQLRNPTDEVLKLIEDEINKNHGKGSYCLKKYYVHGGFDYQFNTAQFTRYIGKKLQQFFGGQLEITARLVTRSRQTSKDLYRITVLFRIPKHKKGDVVGYKGRDVKILNFGAKVYIRDIKTNKKQQVPYDRIF